MGPSCSNVFGFDEPGLGLSQRFFEVANATLERTKVLLGCEAQHARDSLNALVQPGLELSAQPKGAYHELLDSRLAKQLGDSRIFHELEEPFLERGHDC